MVSAFGSIERFVRESAMGSVHHIQPRVLVIDDNEQNRALARATLELEDFEVILAKSGEEGLSAFEAHAPDCVLLDVRMPGMDGFETCRRMRALPGGDAVPIVFLTASRDVDTFDRAQQAGGSDFVTKPVQPTEMVLRVQAALKVRRLDASNQEYFELVRRQRDDLMRLQLQKERLSSFVVHDLKNPVNGIDLLAQLLQRDKSLPAEARETAGAIRSEVASLLRLLLNLLDINKSEEGVLTANKSPVDLGALGRAIIDTAQVRARAREVQLVLDVDGVGTVPADTDLLRRVLENLLENALRYAPKGSRITVSARTHGEAVELRIADEGQGVPVELRDSIFERFVQLATSKDRMVPRTGRGLGLTFCRLAVEAHGGRIYVEDAAPGAVFCILLPQG
jgi:two-component system, sensor histidine kinase and response regulator